MESAISVRKRRSTRIRIFASPPSPSNSPPWLSMLLVHDGKLRYDQTLTGISPIFRRTEKRSTFENLLNHTSGLPDYEDLMNAVEKAKGPVWTPRKTDSRC